MDSKKQDFDIIVVGGGAAGMMSAISARQHHPDKSVTLVERSSEMGRKLLVSGAGRCNLTNLQLQNKPENHFEGTGKPLTKKIFESFGYDAIISFFSDLGVRLAPEKKGEQSKIFPVTQQAKTVLNALEAELKHQGVTILTEKEVINLQYNKKESTFRVQFKNMGESISSQYLILTTGGQTYPMLGSDGAGYELAKVFDHKIIPPIVSAVPLEAKNALSQALQGVKMELGVELYNKDKKITENIGDVIFTKYGLSGSAIFELSRVASVELNRNQVRDLTIKLNFYPGETIADLKKWFKSMAKSRPNKTIVDLLRGSLPFNLPPVILKFMEISVETKVSQLKERQIDALIESLTNYEIKVTATRSWDEAEFTAGGVDASEIKTTLESKKVPGLYFAGEIIDVDGEIGGFNLSWAWSSGFIAGKLE